MAFSLGSIYVELVANTGKFLSGMDQASIAAKRTGKDIRAGMGEISGALASLGPAGQAAGAVLEGVGYKAKEAFDVAGRNGRGLGVLLAGSVLGGITAVGGGMIALANHAAEVGSAIGTASTKTGISATQMSGLYALTKETGGSFEALSTSLARAGANLEKTAEGGGKTSKILWDMMGGAKGAAELGLKPMGDRIQAVLHHIFALHDAGQRNLALNQLLGKGWSENVSTLRLLAMQGYGPAIEQAKRMGVFFDAGAIAQAKQYQVEIRDMTARWSAFTITLGQKVIPFLNRTMIGMQGMGGVIAHTLGILGSVVTMPFEGPKGAMEEWKALKQAWKDAVQQQTDYEVHLQSLTTGQQAATDNEDKLKGGVKAHADALASLIERERDEVVELGIHGGKFRQIQAEYDRTIREIDKYVRAGGSERESLEARSLALDIYRKKIEQATESLLKVPKLPLWGNDFAAAGGAEPIDFTKKMIPPMPGAGTFTEKPALDLTVGQLAKMPTNEDDLSASGRALKQVSEMSAGGMNALAKALGNVSLQSAITDPALQRVIADVARFDKGGAFETFGESVRRGLDGIVIAGDRAGAELANTFLRAVDQIEDSFASLAVTGKGNFKQLFQGIEQNIFKVGLQKAASGILGKFGIGGKADGSRGNPLYVRLADRLALGGGLGAGAGVSGGAPGGGASGAAGGLGGLLSGVGGFFRGAGGGILSVFGKLAGVFGGFLAGGGDVTANHAYVVGEKHPELFVPGASGTVVPSLTTQQLRPLHYAPVYHINTPNADSFRRSQQQLLSDGYRTMTVVHGRNS